MAVIPTPLPPVATSATDRPAFIRKGYIWGFFLVTTLFFLWAVANNFNDILIRQFQKALDLNRAEAGFIQFVFYLAYFVMAVPAGLLMKRFGYRAGILAGLSLYAVGALLFLPASEARVYGIFLGALFLIASGAAFLETAANPYVVAFGDPARAAQRLNLAQAFNGLGGFVAPILGGLFIFSGVEYSTAELAALSPQQLDAWRATEAGMVRMPYLVLAGVVLTIAALFLVVRLPMIEADRDASPSDKGAGLMSAGLIGAVIAQFFYVGAQVGIWSYFIDFTKDVTPEVSERQAAFLLSASLALFMVGRFIGAGLLQKVSASRLLQVYAVIAALLCGIAIVAPGWAAVGALGATSLFMSIMFPTIFALGVSGLGAGAKLGASLIVMAVVGGAVFPPLMGWVAEATGDIRLSMALPLGCFVAVGLYAWRLSAGAVRA